jgi:DNA polymerase (family 10)
METYIRSIVDLDWSLVCLMDNDDVATVLFEIADLLDLQGVAFKPNAYRRAARNINALEEDINKIAAEGRLQDIPGVGEAMTKKIDELIATGELRYLSQLRAEVPPGLVEILKVPDVGPRTAMVLYKELGISSVDGLKEAVLNHKLHGIKGFGEKTEERILQGVRTIESKGGRTLLGYALPVAESYVEYLRSSQPLDRISVAGSLRRGKETVGDIDILVGDDKPAGIMDAFVSYEEVDEILMKGQTKSSVRLKDGLQVDVRAVDTKSWGAALCYFTGSKEHNVTMRTMGVSMGLKLNEYGLFTRESGRKVAGETEEEVYRALGLSYVEPELRENSGEIEAAKEGMLPDLVRDDQILGDMHVHTSWSDGADKIDDVVSEAVNRGYEYVAITDHSQSLKIAKGLSADRLRNQIESIRKAEDSAGGKIKVLAGSEVDIKADGSLDFPNSLLKDLDLVIGSVHSGFKRTKAELTARVTKAIESGRIDILGHPTGRLIGQRNPYEVDLEKVFEAARSAGVCMEINSHPDRLDLSDVHCRQAKDAGVMMAIGTDAHRTEQMGYIRYGIVTARRGWLEHKDVLNTLGWKELSRRFHGGRP